MLIWLIIGAALVTLCVMHLRMPSIPTPGMPSWPGRALDAIDSWSVKRVPVLRACVSVFMLADAVFLVWCVVRVR
jgi:hypothetical protein